MKKILKRQLQLLLVVCLLIGVFIPVLSTKAAYDLTPGYVLTRVDRSFTTGGTATITVSCTANTLLEIMYASHGRFYTATSSVLYTVKVDTTTIMQDMSYNVLSGAGAYGSDYIDKVTTNTHYDQPGSGSHDVIWTYSNLGDYTHLQNTLVVKVYEPIPASAGEFGSIGLLTLLITGLFIINIVYLHKNRKRKS